MILIRLCAILVLLLAMLATPAARAGDLAGFDTALEETTQHNRAALGHLRASDTMLAIIELGRLRESFGLLVERYGRALRDAHDDKAAVTTIMVDVPLRIVTAQMMIDLGRPDIAANSLVAVCRSLGALHEPGDRNAAASCEGDISR